MLKAAGYRVGKYTSPHLVSFTERITINEEEITEAEIADLTAYIRQCAEDVDPARKFTFFDFTTALAFEYFRRKDVDIAMIEVGLGGKLDSTNVVNPLISVITNIAFDHTDFLGEDILDIAREKAGIIKKGVPVVTGAEGDPAHIIEESGRTLGCPVYVAGRDFSYEKKGIQRMSYSGLSMRLDDIYVNLKGDHQLANASIALCAGELLSAYGYRMDEKAILSGLSSVTWPGRIEIVREHPTVILDGAHNVEGVRALASFLISHFPDRKRVLIFGVMKDKEYEKMLHELLPHFSGTVLTATTNERALSPDLMKNIAREAIIANDPASALDKAKTMAGAEDLIVITGSLYLVGECKAMINEIF
jgi:dihydrofolate synthase/folylpolyglutamate synthase